MVGKFVDKNRSHSICTANVELSLRYGSKKKEYFVYKIEGEQVRNTPVASIINLTTSFLRRRKDQRRYLWRASTNIYLAL